eukprot:159407-Pleurochrysis_carterae.AAC.2
MVILLGHRNHPDLPICASSDDNANSGCMAFLAERITITAARCACSSQLVFIEHRRSLIEQVRAIQSTAAARLATKHINSHVMAHVATTH